AGCSTDGGEPVEVGRELAGGSEDPPRLPIPGSPEAQCEEILPARDASGLMGSPLVLAAPAELVLANPSIDLACVYTPRDLDPNRPVPVSVFRLAYTERTRDEAIQALSTYEETVEVGGLPAGLSTQGASGAVLYILGEATAVQVEWSGLDAR